MIKVLFCIIGILILLSIILLSIVYCMNNKLKQMKKDMKSIIDANNYLHDELSKLNSIDKIKSDNRRESNEKINDLYNGDIVDNAINELCNKNKNRNKNNRS